ncbi:MAG: LytTR family DNA-binding domain-containing protein [Eubacteriales bacterium]|nr:LytTR family DNA-binding domain-containing protein [Eubacteriales bacterium]MDD3349889.1 LytTR family DNA-binding domain-containing protein [Eubacteriales bacterium]
MKEYFAVITKQGTTKVRMEDIVYFEKELRKIHLHTEEDVLSFYGSFRSLDERLDERFCRCHYSFVVNLEKVKAVSRYRLNLDNGEILTVSQRFYPNTRKQYTAFLR